MIHDRIENLKCYQSALKLDLVLKYLAQTDLNSLPVGDHFIDGKDLFARVLEYSPWPEEKGRFETHQQYADIQVILKGRERMSVTKRENLTPLDDYNAETDFQFFTTKGEISELVVKNGEFAIFLPGEPHRPGCRLEAEDPDVRKVVFKVRVNQKN